MRSFAVVLCVASSIALVGCSSPSTTDTTGTSSVAVAIPLASSGPAPATAEVSAPSPEALVVPQVIEYDSPIPQAISVTGVTTRYEVNADGEPVWVVSAVLTNRSRIALPGLDVLAVVQSGSGETANRASHSNRVVFGVPVVQEQSVPWQIQVPATRAAGMSSDDTPEGYATVTVERWLDEASLSAKWTPLNVDKERAGRATVTATP